MRIIIILSIFLISFTDFFYAQESYQSIYTGQQLDSAAGSFLGNDFYRVVGGGEKNYPLSVQGLKDAIASLDSGIVYIEYPGLWDTVGVGVIPGKVQVSGWLFGRFYLAKEFYINGEGFYFSDKDSIDSNTNMLIFQRKANTPIGGYIRNIDSTQPTYWGVITGLPGQNFINIGQAAKTPLNPWAPGIAWDDNQAQIYSGPGNYNGLGITTLGDHDIIFATNNWYEKGRFISVTGNFRLKNRLIQKVDVTNVGNPPTATELNSAFPNAMEGEIIFIDDNNGSTNFYQCVKEGSSWWVITGIKAQ